MAIMVLSPYYTWHVTPETGHLTLDTWNVKPFFFLSVTIFSHVDRFSVSGMQEFLFSITRVNTEYQKQCKKKPKKKALIGTRSRPNFLAFIKLKKYELRSQIPSQKVSFATLRALQSPAILTQENIPTKPDFWRLGKRLYRVFSVFPMQRIEVRQCHGRRKSCKISQHNREGLQTTM